MDQQVAVVTGGSRGIGRSISTSLAKAGADVAIVFAQRQEEAEQTASKILSLGRKVSLHRADIANRDRVMEVVRTVLDAWGKIDILVNNAGMHKDNLLMRLHEEDWRVVLDVNLSGVFHITQAVLRSMVKRRFGRIINMSSVVALSGNAGQVNYASAKAGLLGFTRSLAREVAGRGITVNAVAPGYIATEMTGDLPEKQRQALLASIPVGRYGTPEEVAQTVVHLASPWAGYITGHTLRIDGGMAMG
ncbi:3-oxoacyl-[acyl-carrier-protein] reductase [Pasteuria penetrans]|uniref:3-oxoacyl-[acyl-carrier-protein] reductase n=1 Tax=Pasteuria penetrans TaxID=86005 RepID=UPI001FEBFA21|nr:3-oxoacyl-[acyl-carrier-protein] reductase [Pasteuria penetrans]